MMPKPKAGKSNIQNNQRQNNHSSEQILFEAKPNMILYSDNFILKIVVLFFLVFMFNPILALVFHFQGRLRSFYNIDISNLTFIAELIIIFCILIVIVKLILDVLDWNNTVYTLTQKRIIIKRGLFNKETVTMPYSKVQDIDVVQSFMDRIIGVGDIIVYGGHENSETILDAVPNPGEVEEIISERIDNYQINFNGYQQGYLPPNQQGYYPPNQAGGYPGNNYNQGYIQNNNYNNPEYTPDDNYNRQNNYRNNNSYNNNYVNNNSNYMQEDNSNYRGEYNSNYGQNHNQAFEEENYQSNKGNKHNNNYKKYSNNHRQDNYSNQYQNNKSNAHYYENTGDNSIKNRDYTRVSEMEYNNNKLDKDELLSINKRKFKKS